MGLLELILRLYIMSCVGGAGEGLENICRADPQREALVLELSDL